MADINGTPGDDELNGTSGDDLINGLEGNDRISGLDGNDRLNGDQGNDNLFGGGDDDLLRGLAGNDFLDGGIGNDILIGGAGADTMCGGDGNDIYIVDDPLDFVSESDPIRQFTGDDVIATSVSYELGKFLQVETLAAIDGAGAIGLKGNGFANSLYGNDSNNILDGGGGTDYLVGRGGDDTYLVGNSGTIVVEEVGGGSDRVSTAAHFILDAGVEVEFLAAFSLTSTDALRLTGNEFNQQLLGNDGNNILNGGGGADQLIGRAGNDTYVVDLSADEIHEGTGEGDDVISTLTSYVLAMGVSIETMVASGAGWINLAGNQLGQSVYGNAGNNELDGRGGADYLVGGGGSDLFMFTTPLGIGNIDFIGDMASGIDRIGIDNAVFAGLDGGALPAAAFRAGSSAQDAGDRIIYDPNTGALWFDPDGTGPSAMLQFATLLGAPSISASDFVVI